MTIQCRDELELVATCSWPIIKMKCPLTIWKTTTLGLCLVQLLQVAMASSSDHCGILGTEPDSSDIAVNNVESPSDVASVSKFIKEFHRKIDDEVYGMTEPSELVEETTGVSDNSAAKTDPSPGGDSDEVNSTSMVNCKTERQPGSLAVELINSTRLVVLLTADPNITSRSQKAECLVLLFYARTCPFSCMAAPHFNALPRAFPAIKMAAVNVVHYQNFNTQFGIVGVPTVMLFHNGRPASKFNDSEYTLEMFTRFITRHTGILPEEKMFVTSADFGGPVGSVMARETDYYLGLSWLVIAAGLALVVSRSHIWHSIVEAVQNSWREAEAQHFHAE